MPAFPETGPARLPVPEPRGVGHVCPERVRLWGPYQGPHNCRSSRLASAGAAARPAVLIPLSPPLPGVPPEAGPQGLTWPTRLMAQVKQWLAMAAFLASMGHRDSLCERKERDQLADRPAFDSETLGPELRPGCQSCREAHSAHG